MQTGCAKIKIHETRVQLAECQNYNATRVCITACANVGKQLHTLPSHPTLGTPEVLPEESRKEHVACL